MRTLVLASILALIPAPLAVADCIGPVCTEEYSYGPAECTQPGDYGGASTTVTVDGVATVTGYSWCYNDWEVGQGSSDGVSASAGGVSVLWSSFNGVCSTYVYSGENVYDVGCVVGPPNPGWGALLP